MKAIAMYIRTIKPITTASRTPKVTASTITTVERFLISSGEKVPGVCLFRLLADRYRYRLIPKPTRQAVGIAKNRNRNMYTIMVPS